MFGCRLTNNWWDHPRFFSTMCLEPALGIIVTIPETNARSDLWCHPFQVIRINITPELTRILLISSFTSLQWRQLLSVARVHFERVNLSQQSCISLIQWESLPWTGCNAWCDLCARSYGAKQNEWDLWRYMYCACTDPYESIRIPLCLHLLAVARDDGESHDNR